MFWVCDHPHAWAAQYKRFLSIQVYRRLALQAENLFPYAWYPTYIVMRSPSGHQPDKWMTYIFVKLQMLPCVFTSKLVSCRALMFHLTNIIHMQLKSIIQLVKKLNSLRVFGTLDPWEVIVSSCSNWFFRNEEPLVPSHPCH